MKNENFLKNLSIEELIEVRDMSNNLISIYKDEYFYICEVRSYGRNWKDGNISNLYALQDLCYEYYGENGIVDVYSNNPDLSKLDNYGHTKFVPSKKDYEMWKNYTYIKNTIPRIQEELDAWNKRDDLPYYRRPLFAPTYTLEDIEEYKKELESFDMSFVEPVSVRVDQNEDINDDDINGEK